MMLLIWGRAPMLMFRIRARTVGGFFMLRPTFCKGLYTLMTEMPLLLLSDTERPLLRFLLFKKKRWGKTAWGSTFSNSDHNRITKSYFNFDLNEKVHLNTSLLGTSRLSYAISPLFFTNKESGTEIVNSLNSISSSPSPHSWVGL